MEVLYQNEVQESGDWTCSRRRGPAETEWRAVSADSPLIAHNGCKPGLLERLFGEPLDLNT